MKIIARSPLLYLRELSTEDAKVFYTLNCDNDVIKYTGDNPFKDITEAENFLKDYIICYKKFKMGRWAVCLNSNEMIGWCGLKFHPEKELIDLGFRFFKRFWNKGYATEASKLALEYGFNTLKLEIIMAHTHNKNKASARVLQKLGFKKIKNIIYDNVPAMLFELTKINYCDFNQ